LDIYAHRGSSGTHPENTIVAFKEAARLPVYGVEFDVHLTKDKKLVIIHDEAIDRTSNGSGFVKDMTLEELRTYDFGGWFSEEFSGEQIPTLEEVLELYLETGHHLNIELKSDVFRYEGMEELVLDLVSEMKMGDQVLISSFNHEVIQNVKKLNPNLETAALCMKTPVDPLNYVRNLPSNGLHLYLPEAVKSAVHEAIEDGGIVRVFTVNRKDHLEKLHEIGVHAIFTDFPEKMLGYVKNLS